MCRAAPRAVITLAVVLTMRSRSSSSSTVELRALPTSKSTESSAMRFLASSWTMAWRKVPDNIRQASWMFWRSAGVMARSLRSIRSKTP